MLLYKKTALSQNKNANFYKLCYHITKDLQKTIIYAIKKLADASIIYFLFFKISFTPIKMPSLPYS